MRRLIVAVALAFGIPQAASAVQVVLGPGSVVGSSGYYTACCSFAPGSILDQQSGPVTEAFGAGYWLNPDNGPANAYLTIDLGATYVLSSVALFNTHNGDYGDRGTGSFAIYGSNSVAGGQLVGGVLLASGTLNAELAGAGLTTLTAQNFALSGSFRYISFNPITDQASPNSLFGPGVTCCGSNVYGLNEMRVFGSAVPEPASWALLIAGFGLAGAVARRRRAVQA